jgi:hypothetical protein
MADTVHLLNRGRLAYSGPPSGLDEEAVVSEYLGGGVDSGRALTTPMTSVESMATSRPTREVPGRRVLGPQRGAVIGRSDVLVPDGFVRSLGTG